MHDDLQGILQKPFKQSASNLNEAFSFRLNYLRMPNWKKKKKKKSNTAAHLGCSEQKGKAAETASAISVWTKISTFWSLIWNNRNGKP